MRPAYPLPVATLTMPPARSRFAGHAPCAARAPDQEVAHSRCVEDSGSHPGDRDPGVWAEAQAAFLAQERAGHAGSERGPEQAPYKRAPNKQKDQCCIRIRKPQGARERWER